MNWIFPYTFLVYVRLYALAEDLSINVLTLRIIMKVLFILVFMIIFVVVYLPITFFSIIFILLANLVVSWFLGKSPCFSCGKIQNLQGLKILG